VTQVIGAVKCENCRDWFEGYHRCSAGSDRVQFVCSDCDENIARETHDMDVKGLVPQRCATCTLDRMAERPADNGELLEDGE